MLLVHPPDGFRQSIILVRQKALIFAGSQPLASGSCDWQDLPAFGKPSGRIAAVTANVAGSSRRCICVSATSWSGHLTRPTSSRVGLYLHLPAGLPAPETRTPFAKLYSQSPTSESPAAAIAAPIRGCAGSEAHAARSSTPPYWHPQAALAPGNMLPPPPTHVLKAPAPPAPTCMSNWLPATSKPVLIDWAMMSRSTPSTFIR
mmetsp:Transcript_103895/g.318237  ORF Transcript_103895/g.318237 Transcript_103895/m.318237 type:complete len:203 (+) Transcript_103895:178-786(+)